MLVMSILDGGDEDGGLVRQQHPVRLLHMYTSEEKGGERETERYREEKVRKEREVKRERNIRQL